MTTSALCPACHCKHYTTSNGELIAQRGCWADHITPGMAAHNIAARTATIAELRQAHRIEWTRYTQFTPGGTDDGTLKGIDADGSVRHAFPLDTWHADGLHFTVTPPYTGRTGVIIGHFNTLAALHTAVTRWCSAVLWRDDVTFTEGSE